MPGCAERSPGIVVSSDVVKCAKIFDDDPFYDGQGSCDGRPIQTIIMPSRWEEIPAYVLRYRCATHGLAENELEPAMVSLPGIVKRSDRTDEIWYVVSLMVL